MTIKEIAIELKLGQSTVSSAIRKLFSRGEIRSTIDRDGKRKINLFFI